MNTSKSKSVIGKVLLACTSHSYGYFEQFGEVLAKVSPADLATIMDKLVAAFVKDNAGTRLARQVGDITVNQRVGKSAVYQSVV